MNSVFNYTMELNSVIFPAPKRDVSELEFGDSLIWVPVYKASTSMVNPILMNKLKSYLHDNTELSIDNRNIARSIRSKNLPQTSAEVFSHFSSFRKIPPAQDPEPIRLTFEGSLIFHTEPSEKPRHFYTDRPVLSSNTMTRTSPTVFSHISIQKFKLKGDNDPLEDICNKNSEFTLPGKKNIILANLRSKFVKSSTTARNDLNRIQTLANQSKVLLHETSGDSFRQRQGSAELAKERRLKHNSVKISMRLGLSGSSRVLQATERTSTVIKGYNTGESPVNLNQTSRSHSKVIMPRKLPLSTASSIESKAYLQSIDEDIVVHNVGVTHQGASLSRRTFKELEIETTSITPINTKAEMSRIIDYVVERNEDTPIGGTARKINPRAPVFGRQFQSPQLGKGGLINKKDIPEASHPTRKVPCLYFKTAKIGFLNQSMSNKLIIYLHGNAEDLSDASIIPRHISNRLNVS